MMAVIDPEGLTDIWLSTEWDTGVYESVRQTVTHAVIFSSVSDRRQSVSRTFDNDASSWRN